jgi:hypothetical protein
MQNQRLLIACLGAPLLSGIINAIQVGNLGAGLFALLFAYPATFLLGLPTAWLFAKFGWLQFWQAAVAGVVMGLIASVLMGLLLGEAPSAIAADKSLGYFSILFAVHGVAISSAVWFLGVRTR